MTKRSSGILMHISSLAGEYGIGDFGKEAYKFVDFLEEANQKNWQILPLGPTGFGDSPYQSFSAFAGNPYFIDLDEFIGLGYLEKEDIEGFDLGKSDLRVNYGLLYKNKFSLLKLAYNNSKEELGEILLKFFHENIHWVREYALFMSIKSFHNHHSWFNWDDEYKIFDSAKVLEFEKNNEDEIFFWIFTQYFFFKQWMELKTYANKKDIKIIGDIPIYVSEDSSDIWRNPQLFKLDENYIPKFVSGCPPDDFSHRGQLWGNPVYDWEEMKDEDYKWWIERIDYSFKLFDQVRIDHFRGFESYWEIPYGAEDAVSGKWEKGPGMDLFLMIKEKLGDLDIIVEDLGFNTEEVKELVKDAGFPNMKILQFAFNQYEESEYLPHNIGKNTVVYTGTHDNPTLKGWIENISKEEFKYMVKYLNLNFNDGTNWGIIRGAWASNANLSIAPLQDFLELGNGARMNTPSTMGGNWSWRVEKKDLRPELAEKIKEMTKLYWR